MKKTLVLVTACLALSVIGTSIAFADDVSALETAENDAVTSEDGLISIVLPDSSWKQADAEAGINEMYSNGKSEIRFSIYRSDDSNIPARAVTDEEHMLVCEHYEMDQEYVLIASACVHDEDEYEAIADAIDSIELNKDKITEEILNHAAAENDEASTDEVTEEQPDYIGCTFEGTDPWGGELSITLSAVKAGNLEWTLTDIIDDSHTIYCELSTELVNDRCEWDIEGVMGDDNDMTYNYTGSLSCSEYYIELEFASGECTTNSTNGDSDSRQVKALAIGFDTVILE